MRSHYSGQSKSFVEKKRRRKYLVAAAFIVAVISWTVSLSALSKLEALSLSAVNVYGADKREAGLIEAAAWKAMKGSYAGIFSKSSSLLYPKEQMTALVITVSPKIETVEMKLSGLRTLNISVTEKAPQAVICPDLPDLDHIDEAASQVQCYFADEAGRLFKPAPTDSWGSHPRYYIPGLSDKNPVGRFATSTDAWEEWQDLMKAVRSANIDADSLLIKEGGAYELYARNPSGQSIVVIHMTARSSFETQRENLIAFWQKMVSDARANGKTLEWNEIKLQYPPNVYYTVVK